MRFTNQSMNLKGPRGQIRLARNSRGVPCIRAEHPEDLVFGQGFVHANDRQLQVLTTRLAFQGRTSECLTADPELIKVDTMARKINFLPDPESEIAGLDPGVKNQVQAYVDGFNFYFSRNKPVFEFRLLGYKPEPLEIRDVITLAKVMGFVGLAETQGNMEKFILQMIQKGVPESQIRELSPNLTDSIDTELLGKVSMSEPAIPETVSWLGLLPRMSASNSWALSGRLTASGKSCLCNDPHLEVNRLPAIWQEMVLDLPDDTTKGASLPGCPGIVIGRNNDLAFGVTYAFMDMIDWRIEHCRDGKYRRGREWIPFRVRRETLRVKKKAARELVFYENDLGVLEGNPFQEGYYLLMSWAASKGCGATDLSILKLMQARSVQEASAICREVRSGSWCYLFADRYDNIGLQMTGRLFKRPNGVSGLLPRPAWETGDDSLNFVDQEDLPSALNPEEGFLVAANQDLNHLGRASPINMPMASYRADRISELLKQKSRFDSADMQSIQLDLYSVQAEKLLPMIRSTLPDTEKGRLLRDWDCRYDAHSRGATLFEAVYLELILLLFGDHGLGREVMKHLLENMTLFSNYYGYFDRILMNPKASWFQGVDREHLFRKAVTRGLAQDAVPYGQTRQLRLGHLLFGGKLPKCFGFDKGPISLPGSRSSILQGQIFQTMNRTTTFSPSYRMIADLGRTSLLTNIPGGVSDRRFSRLYDNTLEDWLKGVYQELG